jgi:hypothetical protein
VRALAIPLSIAALLLAACGSEGDGAGDGDRAQRTPDPGATEARRRDTAPERSPGRLPSGVAGAERVIRGWSDALRGSDVERATSFFSVPLVVSQGTAGVLGSRARVREFNDGLPCGSRVTGVKRDGEYFVASFVLTERPGKRCDAPGASARVAFKLRGGRLSEWRQLVGQAPPPDLETS